MKAGLLRPRPATHHAAKRQSPHTEWEARKAERVVRWKKLHRERIARGKALPSTSHRRQYDAGSKAARDLARSARVKQLARADPGPVEKAFRILREPTGEPRPLVRSQGNH